jgi:hypothetical protein
MTGTDPNMPRSSKRLGGRHGKTGSWLSRYAVAMYWPPWMKELFKGMLSRQTNAGTEPVEEWKISSAATLGSSVRTRGIFLEVRARLLSALKKFLHIEARTLALRMPEGADDDFRVASAIVAKTLENIENLPVIPREIEDILSISATERHRWLNDGRLRSAGTRTVRLRGRARKITFHVFDPRQVEDLLDRDLVTVWREEDAMTKGENRRRAAGMAALARSQKPARKAGTTSDGAEGEDPHRKPRGWEEFEADGFLR